MAWTRAWFCVRQWDGVTSAARPGARCAGNRLPVLLLCLTALFCLSARSLGAAHTLTDDPFQNAQLVPDDVRVFVSVVNGSALLNRLSTTPMAQGLYEVFERSNTGKAWQKLSHSAHRDPRILFDKLLGRKFILIIPDEVKDPDIEVSNDAPEDPEADEAAPGLFDEWIAIAEVDHRTAKEVVQAFDARVTRRQEGISILQSEDGTLHLAYRDSHLYLGTAGLQERFEDLVYGEPAETLLDAPDFQQARCCQDGQIGVFIRSTHQRRASRQTDAAGSQARSAWLSLSVRLDADSALITWRSPARPSRQSADPPTDREDTSQTALDDEAKALEAGEQMVWRVLDGLTHRPDVLYASVMDTSQKRYRPSSTSPGTTLSWLLRRAERSAGDTVTTPVAFVAITSDAAARRRWGQDQPKDTKPDGPEPAIFHAGLVVDDVYTASAGLDEYVLSIMRKMESSWTAQHPDRQGIAVPDVSVLEPHEERHVDLSPRTRAIEGWPGADSLSLFWRARRVDPSSPAGLWVCSTGSKAQSTLLDRLSCVLLRRQGDTGDHDANQDDNERDSWNRRIWEDAPSLCDTAVLTGAGMIRTGSLSRLLSTWESINSATEHPVYKELYDYRLILAGMNRAYWRSLLVTTPPLPDSFGAEQLPAMQTEVRITWSASGQPRSGR
ncbi:MAG: hypothetical protein HND57_10705 [Planctomycetes bacterium]|nr:hypothetical protein [Planctomycetota bacterium]